MWQMANTSVFKYKTGTWYQTNQYENTLYLRLRQTGDQIQVHIIIKKILWTVVSCEICFNQLTTLILEIIYNVEMIILLAQLQITIKQCGSL